MNGGEFKSSPGKMKVNTELFADVLSVYFISFLNNLIACDSHPLFSICWSWKTTIYKHNIKQCPVHCNYGY